MNLLRDNIEQIEARIVEYLKQKYRDKVKFHYDENNDLIADLPKDEDSNQNRRINTGEVI
jgi:ribosomal protein S17E